MLGIGLRLHTPARLFNAVASHVFGASTVGIWMFDFGVTVFGVMLHVLLCAGAGIVFVVVRSRVKRPAWIVGAGVAASGMVVSLANGHLLGTGLAVLLSFGDLLVCYTVLGASLVIGARLAPPPHIAP